MPKFLVWGTVPVSVCIEVEADNEDDAYDVAYDKFGGVTGFVGNGGMGKLIGVTGSKESINHGDEVDWDNCEEIP